MTLGAKIAAGFILGLLMIVVLGSVTTWATALWTAVLLWAAVLAALAAAQTGPIRGPQPSAQHSGQKVGRDRRSVRLGGGHRRRGRGAAMAVGEVLRPMPPFITFYPAVLLVAAIGGGGPGILATVLSALAADYWFLPPYGSFHVAAPNDVLALGIFTARQPFLSVLAERLRRARWAEAFARRAEERQNWQQNCRGNNEELSQQSEELSQQSEELSQQNEELSQQSEELSRQNEELQSQSEEIQALNDELARREDLLQRCWSRPGWPAASRR